MNIKELQTILPTQEILPKAKISTPHFVRPTEGPTTLRVELESKSHSNKTHLGKTKQVRSSLNRHLKERLPPQTRPRITAMLSETLLRGLWD